LHVKQKLKRNWWALVFIDVSECKNICETVLRSMKAVMAVGPGMMERAATAAARAAAKESKAEMVLSVAWKKTVVQAETVVQVERAVVRRSIKQRNNRRIQFDD
jgi:hypothetical protein